MAGESIAVSEEALARLLSDTFRAGVCCEFGSAEEPLDGWTVAEWVAYVRRRAPSTTRDEECRDLAAAFLKEQAE